MFTSSQMLIYVRDAAASSGFYRNLFDRAPVQASPSFAAFDFDGFTLALWARDKVEPAADGDGSSAELVLIVGEAGAVDEVCSDWKARGVTIIQAPTDLNFGRTFTALDPDGHRLRVCAPTM